MKKTLAAVAVLGAFAASASADVTVYGRVDVGVNYNADSKVVQMKTGQSSGNRYGLKGSEKISEDLTVGFQLEQGFDVDTGADKATTGFHRESRVYVATNYGTFHFGRMGTLSSGVGSTSLSDDLTVFGTGYAAFSGDMNYLVDGDTRRNNVVTYQSPVFGGATFWLQAASDEADGWDHGSSRYYAAAVDYKAGALTAGLVASFTDGACTAASTEGAFVLPEGFELEDGMTLGDALESAGDAVYTETETPAKQGEEKTQFIAGVGYDFGVVKAKLTAAYTDYKVANYDMYGVLLGLSAPVAGGTLDFQYGYADADTKYERQSVAAIYQYPLSKQTSLYAGAGWKEEKAANGAKADEAEYFAGMLHKF